MIEAHVLAIVILGVSSFIVGSIPLKIAGWSRQPFLLSALLCCSGGVILATSIVHMLSEVQSKLPKQAELIFCGGFLLLYAIDEVLHLCLHDLHAHTHSESHGEQNDLQKGGLFDTESLRRVSSSSIDADGLMTAPPITHKHRTSYGTIDKLPKRARFYSLSQSFQEHHPNHSTLSLDARSSEGCCRKHEREKSFQPVVVAPAGFGYSKLEREVDSSSDSSVFSTHLIEECHMEVNKKPCPELSSSSATGLLAALLIHSILEGCSIGVQTDSSQILLVLGAVASHKLVLAFCLGLEMATVGYRGFRYFIALTAFSAGCPIGIVIGVAITHSSNGVFVIEAPLQALAAGSLLYVAAFEVLPRERYKWQHREEMKYGTFLQMLAVLVGFSLIALLNFIADYHDHGN